MRLALCLALLAGQAQALSCVRPDILDSFARAQAVPEDVYLLKGRLLFDESRLPRQDLRDQDPQAPAIPARFEGFALNKAGFTTPYDRTVILQPLCFGPWCGRATSGELAIMFATVKGEDLVIEANPCGGQIFYDPTPGLEATVIACINGRCPS